MSESWRIEQSAEDFFGHQKKRVGLEQRRPVIRRASDLVGPGIGSSAVRVADYNDLLATYDGYYSSAPGAANAPEALGSYVGFVVMDDLLGGKQVFTELASGTEYSRIFQRSPSDAAFITWGSWVLSGGSAEPDMYGPEAVGAISPFASTLQVIRVGPMVTLFGAVSRATGYSDTHVDAATIPDGYKPNVVFDSPGFVFFLTSITYQARIETSGTVRIRMSDARTQTMGLSGMSWITEDDPPA